MQEDGAVGKKLRKIYAHLLRLFLQGYLNSRNFNVFCIEYDIDQIWESNLTQFVHKEEHYYEALYSAYRDIPEAWIDPLFKMFLESIYVLKEDHFAEIIVSILKDYSKWNRDLKTDEPIPLDPDLVSAIAYDLLDLQYDEEDLRMHFQQNGYDLDILLSLHDQKEKEETSGTKTNAVKIEYGIPLENNSIFIVHGHDHATRDSVALYIRQIGLKPIILADAPSGGKTLIEKLEEYQNVNYAIVLLTPDDTGSSKDKMGQIKKPIDLKTRARQNVIFELGLFIGWLGRDRVCPIVKSVEELPSDYLGIVYVPYDKEGAWKLNLIRELRKTGFTIDSKDI
jgi:predicted nucleotide-binding protein